MLYTKMYFKNHYLAHNRHSVNIHLVDKIIKPNQVPKQQNSQPDI